MDLKDLDIKAKANEPMPTCLSVFEQTYYLSSRSLYHQYADNKITIEQAREEKDKVLQMYHEHKIQFDFLQSVCSIEGKLKQLQEQGFNSVLEWEVLKEITRALDKG